MTRSTKNFQMSRSGHKTESALLIVVNLAVDVMLRNFKLNGTNWKHRKLVTTLYAVTAHHKFQLFPQV